MRLTVLLWLVFVGLACGQCPNCPPAKVRVEITVPPAGSQAAPATYYRLVPCEVQRAPVAVTYARPVVMIPQAAPAGEVEAVYGPFGRLRYYRVRH